ncbi:LysR family transcriptional regulator [Marinomonas agarivorans]|nr:LysR family transcriptional regulator [Marinomonas agarivorans]
MTPKQVRSLLAVVQYGSINKAAHYLHLAPSSISAQLKELTNELGVELFEPKGRNIVLSQIGHALLPSLQNFCAQESHIKQLAQEKSQGNLGSISLFAPSSMCIYRVPKIIQTVQSQLPEVEILLVHEPYDYEAALAQGELDAALTMIEPAKVAQKITPFWHSRLLNEEEIIYVVHPDQYDKRLLTLSELNTRNLITTEPECSYRRSAEQRFQQAGLTLQTYQSFSNVEVIKRCVLGNMGIGLLPRCVVEEELKQGILLEQKVEGAPYIFHSLMIYRPQTPLPAKLDAFLALL